MKDASYRDNLITLIGLSVVAAVYLFVVFLPARQRAAEVGREIALAEQSVQEIPLRIAELESLQREVARRDEYLERVASLIPDDPALHGVVAHVADLADASRLKVTRLEPLEASRYESYEAHTFRMSVEGEFAQLVRFLGRLESQERLCRIEELTVLREQGPRAQQPQVDVRFSVYARRAGLAGSAEDSRSSDRVGDDRQRRS